jgi:Flp pilus assembly protein TadD
MNLAGGNTSPWAHVYPVPPLMIYVGGHALSREALMNKTFAVALAVVAALAFAPGTAMAVDDFSPPLSAEHDTGRKAVAAKNWNAAIGALTAAERRDARNADIQNLLGYAYRNSGKLDLAFKHYERALQLNPKHLGAHEYIGEAYLMANNPAKAEEYLAALKRFCSRMCEERDDLEKAIAEYRRRTAAAK